MDPHTIFKRFFGISFPEMEQKPFRRVDNEDQDTDRGWFGGSGHHEGDLFREWHSQHFQEMEQMFEMRKWFEEAFHFSTIPSYDPSVTVILPDGLGKSKPDSGSSARDQMLKEEKRPSQPVQPSQPFSGGFFSPLFEEFARTPQLNTIPPKERKDQDIDSESPGKEEIVDMYRRSKEPFGQSKEPFGQFFSGGSRVNMRTVIGANGAIEERCTKRDSSGCEETTVTRRMGDQAHTVTTVKNKNGEEEIRETFQNIDKDKVSEFNQQWQGKGRLAEPVVTDPDKALQLPPVQGGTLSDNRGFFHKFFGF